MSARYREFEQERDRKIALSRSQLEVQADRSTSAAGALDGSMPREIRREQPFDYQGPSIWGNPSALVQRGLDYMNGCGLPHSDADAVDCFRAAAKQGSAEGQYYLGWMYKLGRGIPADPIKAYMWLSLATWHGEPRASSFCRALEEQMTPAQLSTARSMSKTCQASNYEHCD
jgi:TPR repeat protein